MNKLEIGNYIVNANMDQIDVDRFQARLDMILWDIQLNTNMNTYIVEKQYPDGFRNVFLFLRHKTEKVLGLTFNVGPDMVLQKIDVVDFFSLVVTAKRETHLTDKLFAALERLESKVKGEI